ncbi:MAG: hypothetical protein B7X31_10035 [Thiomonas sp. 13-66-29]|jgi:hypothetical protein|nr:MAG: hypothetical protein B7X31_10035 [Thiomonas sp. 13-66-29]
MVNLPPGLPKYILQRVSQSGHRAAVKEDKAPRFLGFGCFSVHAREAFDDNTALRQIKLKVVAIPEVRGKVSLSVWIRHYVVLERDDIPDRNFRAEQAIELLPCSCMGNGVFVLDRDDPSVAAARQEHDPIVFDSLVHEIGRRMDLSIDDVDVNHDVGPC